MLNAIIPVFLLIVIGYVLKRSSLFSQTFWNDTEKLAYYILFPALLIDKMSVADLSKVDLGPLISALLIGLAVISLFMIIIKPWLKTDNASFTSIFQGTIRFNTYIGFGVVDSLFGSSGLVIAVIVAAILIPGINFITVIVLQYYNRTEKSSVLRTIILILKNPLIVGCVIGISINVLDIHLPLFLQNTIHLVGSTLLPIGLMCVGAALMFKELKSAIKPILQTSTFKFILYPVIAFYLAEFFQLDPQTKYIAVIFASLPTASAAYIMAKTMGGNHQLMARLITFETLLSGLTLIATATLLGI